MGDVCYAERRVKQKVSLNPRGSLWANDNDKFGQKMLEKMGWEKGKGLGSTLQGKTDHVKVKHKVDVKGVGYAGVPDELAAHQSDFDALLVSLNAGNTTESKPTQSLEKKSKSSKSRVHYHKSTRAKDVTNYSQNDLSSILGVKKPDKIITFQPAAEEELKPAENLIINAGSITDYFAAKMAKLKKAAITPQEDTVQLIDNKSDDSGVLQDECQESTKRKKKKKSKDEAIPPQEETDQLVDTKPVTSDDSGELQDSTKRKKKKKRKSKDCEVIEQIVSSSIQPQEGTSQLVDSKPLTSDDSGVLQDEFEESFKRKKKKKSAAKAVTQQIETSSEVTRNNFFTDKMQNMYTDPEEPSKTNKRVSTDTEDGVSCKKTKTVEDEGKKSKKKKKEKTEEDQENYQSIVNKTSAGSGDSIHNFFSAKMQSLYN